MSHRRLRAGLVALVVAIGLASLTVGCNKARVFVEKYGWHPVGTAAVSASTVPVIEPASHDDVSNVLLKDAGLKSLEQLAGQSVETYNFRLNDQRNGNLKGLPLHALVWVREGQVVGAWILPQGDTGDPTRDSYVGGFYSIQGRTLEEVTGQAFQTWRQSRLAASPVTWTIESLDEPWIKAPITVRLTLPQRLRLVFSGDVAQASVEDAIRSNLVEAYQVQTTWRDNRTLDIAILSGPTTEHGLFRHLTPAGGKDASGAVLTSVEAAGRRGPAEMLVGFGPKSTVWRWTFGKGPSQAATLPGAYDVLSVSGDGTKLALRLYGTPTLGGWGAGGPPLGFAYWYDMQSGRLERLAEMGGWLAPQWLADGSLIISASGTANSDEDRGKVGTTLMQVSAAGTQKVLVRNRYVVDYLTSPDGRRLAVFLLGPQGVDAAGDIWIIDLTTGRRREWPGAYTPALGPSGMLGVTALWSPDGCTLVFSDKTGLEQDDTQPYRLVALDPNTGKTRVLLKEVLPSPSWSGAFSPRGDRLYLWGIGEGPTLFHVPGWEPVGETAGYAGDPDWAPNGRFIAFGHGDGSWSVYTADAGELWSTVSREKRATAHPLWSPDGRFLAVPGVGVGDTAGGQFSTLPQDIGVPIGWSTGGTLFLASGRHAFDDPYVKPTQFAR